MIEAMSAYLRLNVAGIGPVMEEKIAQGMRDFISDGGNLLLNNGEEAAAEPVLVIEDIKIKRKKKKTKKKKKKKKVVAKVSDIDELPFVDERGMRLARRREFLKKDDEQEIVVGGFGGIVLHLE